MVYINSCPLFIADFGVPTQSTPVIPKFGSSKNWIQAAKFRITNQIEYLLAFSSLYGNPGGFRQEENASGYSIWFVMRNLAACIQFLDDPNLGITGVKITGSTPSPIEKDNHRIDLRRNRWLPPHIDTSSAQDRHGARSTFEVARNFRTHAQLLLINSSSHDIRLANQSNHYCEARAVFFFPFGTLCDGFPLFPSGWLNSCPFGLIAGAIDLDGWDAVHRYLFKFPVVRGASAIPEYAIFEYIPFSKRTRSWRHVDSHEHM
jgi:hypothetical protein